MMFRSKLRQNNIYIYVFSVLLSNILFSSLVSYQLINHYYQFEGDPTSGASAIRNWWVFRKSLLPATYLVMIANIGGLIFAIQSGNDIIAKAANAQTLDGKASAGFFTQNQRKKAKIIVSLAWIVPPALALLTLTGWNCGNTCACLSGCYSLQDIEKDHTRPCSRLLSAVSNSYMAIIAVLWVIEIAALFFTICKTFSHSLMLSAGCLAKSGNAEESADVKDETGSGVSAAESPPQLISKSKELPRDDRKSSSRKRSRRSRRADRRQRRYAKWLRRTSKQLAYLSMLFFICTLPSLLWFMLDIFLQKMLPTLVNNILISLPIAYAMICPIVLAKDLAGLKSAIISLILKIFPASRTKHQSGTYTSSSFSDHESVRK